MANEAIKRYSNSAAGDVIIDYTCADGVTIEKGTILSLADPRTVAASAAAAEPCAGIAAREKIASDGRTRIAVHKQGYFDVSASGAILIGAPCMSAGVANQVKAAIPLTTVSGACILGYAEETAADGEVYVMRLNL